MNFKKILALMLVLVLALAACTPKDGDSKEPAQNSGQEQESKEEGQDDGQKELTEDTKIVFWHAMNGKQEEALKKLTDDFMAQNKNIKVELQNQVGYKELQQKITSTSASPKDLPTMTQAYPDWMFNPIKDGLVYELTDFTKRLEGYEDILEGFRKGTEIDGKVYSMPFNKSTEVLWYNEDIFNELGLQVPTNYDELKEVSKKIYQAKDIPGLGFDSLSNYYTTFITAEGQVYDKDFDVTSDASKKAVNYYLDGVKEGYFRIAGTDKYMSGPLGEQKVAMYIGSNAGETYVLEGAKGKFIAKAAPAPTPVTIQQGTDIFVFNNADDNQKLAAEKFIEFITGKEQQIEWGKATGYIPARKSAIEDENYKNSGSLIAPILEDATKNLYTNPVMGGANQAYLEAATMMEEVLTQPETADVDSILENFKTTLEGIWE